MLDVCAIWQCMCAIDMCHMRAWHTHNIPVGDLTPLFDPTKCERRTFRVMGSNLHGHMKQSIKWGIGRVQRLGL